MTCSGPGVEALDGVARECDHAFSDLVSTAKAVGFEEDPGRTLRLRVPEDLNPKPSLTLKLYHKFLFKVQLTRLRAYVQFRFRLQSVVAFP